MVMDKDSRKQEGTTSTMWCECCVPWQLGGRVMRSPTADAVAGDRQCSGGFTRVVVGQIKPDILRQISDDQGGRQLCRCAGLWSNSRHSCTSLGMSSTCMYCIGGVHPIAWHVPGSCSLVMTFTISPNTGARIVGPFLCGQATGQGDSVRASCDPWEGSLSQLWRLSKIISVGYNMVRNGQCIRPDGLACTCRDLSHLYHYYLHGPTGNRSGGSGSDGVPASQAARGGAPPLPEIVLQCLAGGRPAWRVNLAEVADDLESQCLQVLATPREAALHCEAQLDRSLRHRLLSLGVIAGRGFVIQSCRLVRRGATSGTAGRSVVRHCPTGRLSWCSRMRRCSVLATLLLSSSNRRPM